MNQLVFDRKRFHARSVRECRTLSDAVLWSSHADSIWRPRVFAGRPHFYAVYRLGDLYSFSLLSLILHKRSICLNKDVAQQVQASGFLYQSGRATIDREVTRVGGPIAPRFRVRDPDVFARHIALAMRADAAEVERLNANFTNIVLCGGRDSLTMLLLPWRHPVLVASAQPNYPLVREFLSRNGLPFDLVELDDSDSGLLRAEILVNACRNNLAHCRWGPHLVRLARSYGEHVVFWKGQAGDILMTPKWRGYSHGPDNLAELPRNIARYFAGRGEFRLRRWLEASTIRQRRWARALWTRAAMWQGAHMGIIRDLTDALVVSGYHGPSLQRLWSEVDLRSAVTEDIRPKVGQYLAGRPVWYPPTNPSPPISEIRTGGAYLPAFLETLRQLGIQVK